MKITQDQFQQFQQLAEEIGGDVYENYSGRGMFGERCLVITVDNLYFSLFDLGRLVESMEIDFSHMMAELRVDNLGTRDIIYFPRLEGVEK